MSGRCCDAESPKIFNPVVRVQNDVMLQHLVSISDVRQCTCDIHKSRPTTMVDSDLPPLWIPSYHHCGFRPTTIVDSVLPPLWIPSYHHCEFRPTTIVDSVLPPLWIPSYHHCGFRPTTMVDSVLPPWWIPSHTMTLPSPTRSTCCTQFGA